MERVGRARGPGASPRGKSPGRQRAIPRGLPCAALALGLLVAPPAPARAQAGEGADAPPPAPSAPATTAPATTGPAATGATPPGSVDLDRLLKLPSSRTYTVDRRGGYTEGEWRSRFQEVHKALEGERTALAEAEGKLDKVASSADAWKMAPPVPGLDAGTSDAPLDFKLRTEIRRHQNEIDRLEHRLRELEIEANLAGVPEDWRT